MLNEQQIAELRTSVAKGYQYPPDPFRNVKLTGGPLDGVKIKVSADLKPGGSVAFNFHHGRGYVAVGYKCDECSTVGVMAAANLAPRNNTQRITRN
jgi:hypothetical protein